MEATSRSDLRYLAHAELEEACAVCEPLQRSVIIPANTNRPTSAPAGSESVNPPGIPARCDGDGAICNREETDAYCRSLKETYERQCEQYTDTLFTPTPPVAICTSALERSVWRTPLVYFHFLICFI